MRLPIMQLGTNNVSNAYWINIWQVNRVPGTRRRRGCPTWTGRRISSPSRSSTVSLGVSCRRMQLPVAQRTTHASAALPSAPSPGCSRWPERNVHSHRVAGRRAVTLSLQHAGQAPGDVTADQMGAAAEIPDRFSTGGRSLRNDDAIEELVRDLPRLLLIALVFPNWTDGRAYSHARLLRSRYRFNGEVRACGEILVDMLPLFVRTGFDRVVLRSDQSAQPRIAR